MDLLRYFVVVFFVVSVGCSAQSPVLPVQGDLIGRSERFCISLSERAETGNGYICKQFDRFFLEVEAAYGTSPQDDVRFAIAGAFEKKIIAHIRQLREKANVNTDIYYQGPIKGFDDDIRLSIPIKNALRIEIHLLDKEVDQDDSNLICQNYVLLMLTSDMYLRTINKHCSNSKSVDYVNGVSSEIANKIYNILENDIFK